MCVLSERENDALRVITALCGLNVPDSGSVKTEGAVRFISKNAPIPSFLTVKEYFETVRAITGHTDTPEIAKETEEKYQNNVIGTLADLERYYVAISAALIGSPSAIAIAYPFNGIPFDQREPLNKYIDCISEMTPVIYTSTYPSLCRDTEQVLVLSAGRCVGSGTAEKVFGTQSPTLVCKVKGDTTDLDLDALNVRYDVRSTDDESVSEITLYSDGKEFRESVKEAIADAGLALLSAKGEHDTLKKVIEALDVSETEEAERFDTATAPKKLSAESLSISNESDNEFEDTDTVSNKKLTKLEFYSDDEEESDANESTLFSDEGRDEE